MLHVWGTLLGTMQGWGSFSYIYSYFALPEDPGLDSPTRWLPFSLCPFPILHPKSNVNTKDCISVYSGFFHSIPLDFLCEAVTLLQLYWSVFIAQKGGHKTVCDLQKSHLFCLCFSVPCSWLFRAYIKTGNVAFLRSHCATLPSFPSPSSEEGSQEKNVVHVEIFVPLSMGMISKILSLPRFTIVKWDQNPALRGKCYFWNWSETAAFKTSDAGWLS